MHVDACVGGLILPFMRENGEELPAFDFGVEGVTSISADLHKYGFAPKGVSVILQRRRDLRDAQYYACANWSGYAIVNATTLGSKSVAAMGAASAVIHWLGREGYRERVAKMWDATKKVVAAIDGIDELEMVGRPDTNLLAFKTKSGDLFELADRLEESGWHVQPTYSFGRSPAHIHLTLDPGNADNAGRFIEDLKKSVKDLPEAQEPPAAIVQMLSALTGAGQGVDAAELMTMLGITDGRLPERAAGIHRILEAAPPPVREQLLILFVGELFT